jgi:hypothetical protein
VWRHRSSQNCHRGGYGSWGGGFPRSYLTLKSWEGLLWLFEIFDNPLPSNSFEDSKVNLALKQWKYESNNTQKNKCIWTYMTWLEDVEKAQGHEGYCSS